MKIRLATKKELKKHLRHDPVRPHIKAEWRTSYGREVYVLDNKGNIEAVLCVAYTDDVPKNEKDMSIPGLDVAVFYTVWSYDKGAGREIVNTVAEHIKTTNPYIKRYVTLSPLTEMARNFHLRNGAKFISKHTDCQNFEYTL